MTRALLRHSALRIRPARLACALALLCAGGIAQAQAERGGGMALGVGISTLGLGGEVSYRLGDFLNLRVTGHALDADTDLSHEDEGVNRSYDLDLYSNSFGVIADLHPFGNGFRLSGGYYPRFRLRGRALEHCAAGCDIGESTVSGADVRYLREARWSAPVPYAGLGFSNVFNERWPLYYKVELGAVFLDEPAASTRLTGSAATITPQDGSAPRSTASVSGDAPLQQQAARDAARLQGDLEEMKVYPVLGFWLGARFGGGPVAAKPEPASQASPTTRPARFTSRLTGPQTVTRIEQNRSPVPQLTASDQLAREIDPTLMPPAMLKDLPPGFRPVIYYAPDQR